MRPLDWLANPILARELRARFRGNRSFLTLTMFVLVEIGLFFIIFASSAGTDAVLDAGGHAVGRRAFEAFAGVLAFLVCVSTPSAAAHVIAVEREKRTLEFLELTLLTPLEIVVGKLAVSLLYVSVLAVTALPVVSLVFVFGGVSPRQVAALYAGLGLIALALASLGVWISSWCKTTVVATGVTFGLGFFALPFGVAALGELFRGSRGGLGRALAPAASWFGWGVPPLLLFAVPVVLLAHVAVQHAAGRLSNPEHDAPTGERASLWLAFTGLLALAAGLIHPDASMAARGFNVYVGLEALLLIAMMAVPAVARETRRERARGVSAMLSPRAALREPVLGLPWFVAGLCASGAALHAATVAATGAWSADFALRWACTHAILSAIAVGVTLALTAAAAFWECLFPITPPVIRLMFAAIFVWSLFVAEALDFALARHPDPLPWPAGVMAHLSPLNALDAVSDELGVEAAQRFARTPWSGLAPFPGRHVAAWIGALALYGLMGAAAAAAIALVHRIGGGRRG